MSQRTIRVSAPDHLMEIGAQIAVKNRMTPQGVIFDTNHEGEWFIIRGTLRGVSVNYYGKYRP